MMALNKLSTKSIQEAKPKEKAYTIGDGGGLQLLVKPNGTKLWEFFYQSPTLFKRRRTSIGTYPDVSLKIAREKRKKFVELIHRELDPIDEKDKTKQIKELKKKSDFEKVVKEWFENQKDNLAASTYTRKLGLFENDVIPSFKNRDIATIEHDEIVTILEKKSKKTPETASRLFSYLDNLWRYATTKKYCNFNIIANIHKQSILRPVQQKSYAKVTDLPILKELINSIYTDKEMHPSTKNALKFVLHLPLRANNLINLTWENINFNDKVLTIPRKQMKNKNINLPDFTMPLSDEVINILKEQYQLTSNKPFVFMGDKNKPIHAETPNRALQRLEFNNEVKGRKQRLHSFRGTFRSTAETYEPEHNIQEKVQEIALDHYSKNAAKMAYKNKANYLKQLTLLMNWWSGFIVEMIDEE